LSTSILGIRDEQLLVDPVGGCNTIRPGMVVYDRKEVREIAFENLMSEYKFGLTEAIRTAHARVKLRGLGHSRGGADCSVNLMWAAP
jgi:hypothetical protein